MIYHLRSKFIKICMLSFMTVFVIFLIAIYLFSSIRINRQLDGLVDIIFENDGSFPELDPESLKELQEQSPDKNILNLDSPFSTRFFTVWLDSSDQVTRTDTSYISSITEAEADEYAGILTLSRQNFLHIQDKQKGWINNFRYKKYTDENGSVVIFVDGTVPLSASRSVMLTCICVFIAVTLIVLLLVIIFSKYVVRPIAESYEKQKRFITDASHELKTPLTLILTNTEIVQSEIGPNEWLDDIKSEGEQMSLLIRRMISLARMDEADTVLEQQPFDLSAVLLEVTEAFTPAIYDKKLHLVTEIPGSLTCTANEPAIRQLLSILMDNAVKYCDPQGTICITLKQSVGLKHKTHAILTIDNTYANVSSLSLNHLFDRFYRSDQARTSGEGFGIGLSIAQSIAEKHHTHLTVHSIDNTTIRFRINL